METVKQIRDRLANMPAFPVPHDALQDREGGVRGYVRDYSPLFEGMTYRQWLIGMSMQGQMSNPEEVACSPDAAGRTVLKCTDALLELMAKAEHAEAQEKLILSTP